MDNLTDLLKDISSDNISNNQALEILKQMQEEKSLTEYPFKVDYSSTDFIVEGHTIGGVRVMMGVTHLSLMLNHLVNQTPKDHNAVSLRKFNLLQPFVLKEGETGTIEVKNQNDKVITDCNTTSTGTVYFQASSSKFSSENISTAEKMKSQIFLNGEANTAKNGYKIYDKLAEVQVTYRKGLQSIESFVFSENGYKGTVHMSDDVVDEFDTYYVHPTLIDSAFLIATADLDAGFVPLFVKQITAYKNCKQTRTYYCETKIQKHNDEIQIMDFDIYNEEGHLVVKAVGFTSKKVPIDQDAINDFLNPNLALQVTAINESGISETLTEVKRERIVRQEPEEIIEYSDDELQEMVQELILQQVIKATGMNDLTLDEILEKNFMEIGADSKNLIGISKTLEDELNIELYPTLFFEYQNVMELSGYFVDEHRESFQEYFNLITKPEQRIDVTKSEEVVTKEEKIIKPLIQPIQIQSKTQEIPAGDSFQYNGRTYKTSDMAIVGMSAKLPKSDSLDEFWDSINSGLALTGEIPKTHWDYRPWYDPDCSMDDRKINCKWGGFLNSIDQFDAAFFNVSPQEAKLMDPQLRVLLEEMYATTEDAGIINKIKNTNTGVFIGICSHDYSDNAKAVGKVIHPYDGTGNSMTMFPNRASYFFDIHGPSYPIDTACSSSLVALYSACRSIQSGDCDMAFVAGTNLLLSPDHYVYFSKLGVLSKKGLTTTFDDKADGYVPGESVSVILIKPLKNAIEDGDNIHAVIKGVSAGHGGYTNTITAPSPNKEAEVIKNAWADAQIDPKTVSYVEAHGTGTKLGDPIEMDGLNIAFRDHIAEEPYCFVGSAKANIGHTEGSAGISGLLKVVMSMKNKTIPPLANFTKLNAFIQLDKSMLKINTESIPWEPIQGVRRAGVSSFGFGGAYAHTILEDFEFEKRTEPALRKVLILISAYNEKSLENNVNLVLNYFRKEEIDQEKLTAIAYTLQVGRQAMQHRIAFMVNSADQVVTKLTSYLAKGKGVYQNVINKKDKPIVSHTDKDDLEYLHRLLRANKMEKLLKLWLIGTVIEWEKLYKERPRILSLPTYGFDRKRYWYDLPQAIEMQASDSFVASQLHPLLDMNKSSLKRTVFSKTFSDKEFFLHDHHVKMVPVLPGVAVLEMFRASAELAAEQPIHRLQNIVWKSPLMVQNSLQLAEVELVRNKEHTLSVTLQSKQNGENEIHAIGIVDTKFVFEKSQQEHFDVQQIFDRTSQVQTKDKLYADFTEAGLRLGKSMQGVQEIWGNAEEALSILKLPSGSLKFDDFTLHPTLLDSALHSVVGVQLEGGEFIGLPFSMDGVEIQGELTKEMYSYVQLDQTSNHSEVHKSFNIWLLDKDGNCSVKITKFTVLNLGLHTAKIEAKASQSELKYIVSSWKEEAVNRREANISDVKIYAFGEEQLWTKKGSITSDIVFIEKEKIVDWNEDQPLCLVNVVPVSFENIDLIAYHQEWILYLRKLIQEKPKGEIKIMFVALGESEMSENNELLQLFLGFFKAFRLEESRVQFKAVNLINSEAKSNVNTWFDELHMNGDWVCYKDNIRNIQSWKEYASSKEKTVEILQNKNYLVTGGTGGIGRVITNHILQKNANAIIIGRKELSEEDLKVIFPEETERLQYIQHDLSSAFDLNSIKTIFAEINIDGIFHCAGVTKDKLFKQLTKEEERAVLTPKITGYDILDSVFEDQSLDFMVLFSSLASVIGNVGQTVYAGANSYLDAIAYKRNLLMKNNQRMGHTISVNWSYWKEGGMKISKTGEQLLFNMLGQEALSNSDGLAALEELLSFNASQVVVGTGNIGKLLGMLNHSPKFGFETKIRKSQSVNVGDREEQIEQIILKLKGIIAEILTIEVGDIDDETELTDLGLDSVVGMQLVEIMMKTFGNKLSPTILFDYPTIKDISEFLVENDFELDEILEEMNNTVPSLIENVITEAKEERSSVWDEMKQVVLDTSAGKITFYIKGSGTPIVFLSGFGMSVQVWERQLKVFTKEHQCIFVQLPKYRSGEISEDVSFEALADEIKIELENQKIKGAILIGWSMGGMISQVLTSKYPNFFTKQLLINSSANIQKTVAFGKESNLLNFRKDVEDLYLNELTGLPSKRNILDMLEKSQMLDAHGKLVYGKAFMGFDHRNELDKISLPTLVIGSKFDSMIPNEENLHLSENIPDADFVMFECSGHFPFLTERDLFNEKVLSFINN